MATTTMTLWIKGTSPLVVHRCSHVDIFYKGKTMSRMMYNELIKKEKGEKK